MPVIALTFVAFAVLMVGVCVNSAPLSCPDGSEPFRAVPIVHGAQQRFGEIVE